MVFTVSNGAKHALCPCHGARSLCEDGASLDDRDYRAELFFKPDSTHGALELSIDVLKTWIRQSRSIMTIAVILNVYQKRFYMSTTFLGQR